MERSLGPLRDRNGQITVESELKEIDTGSNLLSGSFKFYRFCSADDYLRLKGILNKKVTR